MNAQFSVTWERVNDAEATEGDTMRRGFVIRDVSLHDAVQACEREQCPMSETASTYASDSEPRMARWYSAEIREWESGDTLTLSVHFPDSTTGSSRARLCRALDRAL